MPPSQPEIGGGDAVTEKSKGKQERKNDKIKLRFWTNDIAKGSGYIAPKHAWGSGVVRLERNTSHGIKPSNPRPFRSLLDIGAVVEKVLIAHGIVLHPSEQMRRYLD
jgi:hypothetical protein